MSLYSTWNYRQLLTERVRELKSQKAGWTLQRLSHKTGLQAPYLTNVLKERAHLSLDQAFAIGRELDFSPEERQHLLLLVDWERCGHSERKLHLRQKIEAERKEKLKSKAHLQKEILEPGTAEETQFFLNPYYKILNSFMAVERFSQKPQLIAACLHLSLEQVDGWLKDLVRMGFLRRTNKGFEKLKRNFHLSKESPLCGPHQNLLAQTAARHIQSLPESEKFNFAVTFSADAQTRDEVQREFLKFLKNIEGLVKKAPSEDVFGMSFDLFRWSQPSDS